VLRFVVGIRITYCSHWLLRLLLVCRGMFLPDPAPLPKILDLWILFSASLGLQRSGWNGIDLNAVSIRSACGFVPGKNSVTSCALPCLNISNCLSMEPGVAYMNVNPTLLARVGSATSFPVNTICWLLIVSIVKEGRSGPRCLVGAGFCA
jgi:hypothetical protein